MAKAGIAPDIKQCRGDCCANTANISSGILGGKMGPTIEVAAVTAQA